MTEAAEQRTSASELLSIYLHDHRAGAAAGIQLVRRCREQAGSGELATTLAWLETEIDADRRTLDTIMEGLDVKQSPLKNALGVVAERAGRLKLNGHLFKRSPLSTLLELEALAAAIYTKRNLWRSLAAIAERSSVGDSVKLAELIDRATAQLERVQAHHDDAAVDVFDAASTGGGVEAPPAGATATQDMATAAVVTSPAPSDDTDLLLDDAEGGIVGSILDAPDESGTAST